MSYPPPALSACNLVAVGFAPAARAAGWVWTVGRRVSACNPATPHPTAAPHSRHPPRTLRSMSDPPPASLPASLGRRARGRRRAADVGWRGGGRRTLCVPHPTRRPLVRAPAWDAECRVRGLPVAGASGGQGAAGGGRRVAGGGVFAHLPGTQSAGRAGCERQGRAVEASDEWRAAGGRWTQQQQTSAMGLEDDAAVLPLMPSVPLKLLTLMPQLMHLITIHGNLLTSTQVVGISIQPTDRSVNFN
ncbi:hypothetical protein GGX14DRAFT_400691 [Mycena pura]|uniref:Uncharacterized protein n=1 Tax=Mycena pura TaxID=153505 RepID=A0AAD6V8Z5_9AGAR|nr:hypothetical protein GGX14DRAFT_400691 [Mycena pura]